MFVTVVFITETLYTSVFLETIPIKPPTPLELFPVIDEFLITTFSTKVSPFSTRPMRPPALSDVEIVMLSTTKLRMVAPFALGNKPP